MRSSKSLLFLSWCALFLLLPAFSSAEVKITLKNGRSFVVESCKETGAKLICDMEGGAIELDRQDIESIKDVKMQRRAPADEASTAEQVRDEAAAGEPKKEEKPVETVKPDGKNGSARTVSGLNAEQMKKYDELEKRRGGLAADREKLIKDREDLLQEVKDTGVIRSREKLDAIQQKINALDQRINGFNEQVNKLNEEIAALTAEGQKKQP